jgi:hypothetical protein
MDYSVIREGRTFRIDIGRNGTDDERALAERALRLLCVDDRDVLVTEDGTIEAKVASGVTSSEVVGIIACAQEASMQSPIDTRPL